MGNSEGRVRPLPQLFALRAGIAAARKEARNLETTNQTFELLDSSRLKALRSEGRTFYILGSGASVNDLGKNEWDEVSAGFSVGLNSWAFHPFVPSAYAFENPRHKTFDAQADAINAGLERNQVIDAQPSIFFFRNPPVPSYAKTLRIPAGLSGFTRVYGRVQFPRVREQALEGLLRGYFRFQTDASSSSTLLLDNGSTVIRMIDLALKTGFNKIVLLGVDLGSRPYFFEDDPSVLSRLGLPPLRLSDSSGSHATQDEHSRTTSFTVFLRALSRVVTETHSTDIRFVGASPALKGVIRQHGL